MNTLLDTGPLVAMIDERDEHHEWAIRQANALDPPFYTCEAVLTEAYFLLSRVPMGTEKLHGLVERGRFNLSFSFREEQQRILALMRSYADQPMSFADACLVRMQKTRRSAQVFTTDDDFYVYRTDEGEALDVIAPR